MKRKQFDKDLHAENDLPARKYVLKLFKNLAPYNVKESEKKRDVDFKIFKGSEHVGYLEVEIKRVWKGKDFTYDSVNFPERKWKYANLDKPTIFLMLNENCSHYLAVDGKALLSSPLKVVPNKYVGYGENFFKVDLKKVVFDDIMAVIERLEL